MLIKQETLRGVAEGSITLAFRRWYRPTVKAGGTLLTTAGLVSIDAVDHVDLDDITEREAADAGFADLKELHFVLLNRTEGSLYRVALHLTGPDPRIALREQVPDDCGELTELRARLARWDKASKAGPWTRAVLSLLKQRPAVRAADLSTAVDMEKDRFKTNVRKLKGIGLTESLEVGYRLSPRGEAVLRFIEEAVTERGGYQ